jgi:hypothetical protein
MIVIVVGGTLALAYAGRQWWCACGEPFLWSAEVASQHNSQHLFDPYSFSHFLHGIIFYAVGWLFFRNRSFGFWLVLATALETGWEILENSPFIIERYRTTTMALGYSGDSIFNSLGDIVACLAGFCVASRITARASIMLFMLIELLCLLTIHDNLTLNVIMLTWPIDAIREWQMGA